VNDIALYTRGAASKSLGSGRGWVASALAAAGNATAIASTLRQHHKTRAVPRDWVLVAWSPSPLRPLAGSRPAELPEAAGNPLCSGAADSEALEAPSINPTSGVEVDVSAPVTRVAAVPRCAGAAAVCFGRNPARSAPIFAGTSSAEMVQPAVA
jgi:hypothetical protein